MQTNSEFNRSAPFMLALVLCGCQTGGDDGVGEDEVETATVMASESGGTTPSTTATDTNTEHTSTETTTDTDTGETGTANCEQNDAWEPNASAMHPSMMLWQSTDEWSARHVIDDAYLCEGEGDWYHFDVASLGYAEHFLYVRALVEDAGLCGAACDQPVIPAGPEYAMTVEIYRVKGMQLLTSTSDDDGVLPLAGFGDDFADELLIHVFSPNLKAEYSYRLSVEVRNYDGEDECEC